MATPSLSSVSPTSYASDNNNHTMRVLGSNFVSGDTLTFTDPQGNIFNSNSTKLTFVSSSEIDYQFNDASDAGTWFVRVNSPDNSLHSSFFSFNVAAAVVTPSISSVSPSSYASDNNNHTMQVFGSNFVSGDTLTFTDPQGNVINSNSAKLTFVSSNEIDYQFNDASDAGAWSVRVNSPDNSQHSSSLSFNVAAAVVTPSISSVSPSSYASDNNNHTMQVFGSNFVSGDSLTFTDPQGNVINSNSAKLTFVSSNEIDYQFNDASDAGAWSVRVNSPDNSQHSSSLSFNVAAAVVTPSISSVSPSSYASDNNNHTMQVFGSNFVSGDSLTFTDPQGNVINSNSAKLTFVSSSEIDYQFNDASDAGAWSVRVNSPDNSQHSSSLSFNVAAAVVTPSISSVSPSSYASDNNNHTMQVFGSNFVSGDSLTFTDPQGNVINSNSAKLTFVSSSEIDYQFNDASDAGAWSVRVNSPDNSQHSSSFSFNVAAAASTPSISSVSPTSYASDNNNHTMKVFGSNFANGDTLTFVDPQGNTFTSNSAKLTFVSSSEIDYQFNDGSDPGAWSVRVNSPDNSQHSAFSTFAVAPSSPPGTIVIPLPFDSGGAAVNVTQQPGQGDHTGSLSTAYDFQLAFGTAVRAVGAGTVVDIRETVPDGTSRALANSDGDNNPANDDPSLGSGAIGNIVTILYNPGTANAFYATYMHLEKDSVPVAVGDSVFAGEVIGLVGNTGARTGTHLHFQVGPSTLSFGYTDYGNWPADSDNGVPQTIADAQASFFGTVQFAGYGATLPATVVGSNLPVSNLSPAISSVSPGSYAADANNHAMKVLGSNFQNGDTLTFTDPQGNTYQSNAAKLTFVSSTEIDYQFNDGNDAGAWTVVVNSPDGTKHSSGSSFTVASSGGGGGSGGSGLRGIDFQDARAVSASQIKDAGYDFVMNYIGTTSANYLTAAEANSYIGAGLSIVSIYEVTNRNNTDWSVNYGVKVLGLSETAANDRYMLNDLGYNAGKTDGKNAYNVAHNANGLNQPAGSAIYFAIDGDTAHNAAYIQQVTEYFRGVRDGFNEASNNNPIYKIGIYGGGEALDAVYNLGYAQYKWLAAAGQWAGSSGYANYDIKQGVQDVATFGTPVDPDQTQGLSFGQWPPAVNHAPVLNVPSTTVTATAGQVIQASSLFSATDQDGNALTYYLYDGTTNASSGHWVVNGNAIAAGSTFVITAAQLAQTSFVAGSVSDEIFMQASDGLLLSNTGHVTISTAVNHAPVLNVPSATVAATAGQTIQASSLFSATDQDGDALTYYLYDGTTNANSGHWVVNGNAIAAGTTVAITAAQLAQTSFVAGSVSDEIFMQAADAKVLSNTGHITISTAVNHAPVLNVPSATVAATAGQTIQASSLFSATDQDGDTLTYYLYDGTTNANSGHWVVNGNAIAAGTTVAITAAQLAQTSFVAGSVSDELFMQAADAKVLSNTGHVTISTAVNHAPVLNVSSSTVAATAGQTIQASSLFSATDQDGDTLTYYLYDGTTNANSGHWVVNGNAIAAGTTVAITAAQLAQTSFVAGSVSDELFMQASDGLVLSNTGHITVSTSVNHAPVLNVSSSTVAATAGQTIQASSLFSATDQDGDTLVYYLYDGTTNPNSGHWVVNGNAIAAGTTVAVTAAQLAQTSFVTGSVSDELFMQAADAKVLSNTGHITVSIGAGQTPIANALAWNDTASQSFNFADGNAPAFTAGMSAQAAEPALLSHLTEDHAVDALLSALRDGVEQQLAAAPPEIHDAMSQLKLSIFGGTDHSIL